MVHETTSRENLFDQKIDTQNLSEASTGTLQKIGKKLKKFDKEFWGNMRGKRPVEQL